MAAELPSRAKVRAGRRPGRPDTRALVLQAATAEFALKGFDRATLRSIAAAAGVDAALVHHYFGSKGDLLLAALEVPFDPREVIPELAEAGADGLGTRIAERFVSIWDTEEQRLPLVALIRTSVSSEAASAVLRDGLVRMILDPISAAIDSPDAALRAQFVASQLLGLAVARYVLRLEPLASTPAETVVAFVAATLQRYIDGKPA
ncbi:MAG: TetR family transcriptional regulator [Nocardioidaceae bacterium]